MPLLVTNATRGKILADQAEKAERFGARFRGLMGRRELPVGHGLWIVPCNSIHTFFMRIPIDVAFLDEAQAVVKLVGAIPPWRMTSVTWKARSVLELPAGTLDASGTREGDVLTFESRQQAL